MKDTQLYSMQKLTQRNMIMFYLKAHTYTLSDE